MKIAGCWQGNNFCSRYAVLELPRPRRGDLQAGVTPWLQKLFPRQQPLL